MSTLLAIIIFLAQLHDFQSVEFLGQHDILDYTAGNATGLPIVVASTAGDSVTPSAATDGETLVVVWNELTAGHSQFYAARSTDGVTWTWGPISDTDGGERPQVVALRRGVFRVYFDAPDRKLSPHWYVEYRDGAWQRGAWGFTWQHVYLPLTQR